MIDYSAMYKTKSVFEWKDLNKKFFQLIHTPANVNVNEPIEQVFLVDPETKTFYLIHSKNVLEADNDRS